MQIPINRPAQVSLNPFEKTVLEVYNRYGCDAFETSKALRLPSHEVKNIIAEIRAKGHDDLIGGTDMARGQKTPPEVIEKIRELHESGKTQAEIMRETDLPNSTVSYIVRNRIGGATSPKPEESVSDVKVNMEKMIANHCRNEDFTPAPEPSEDDKLPPYPTDEERKAWTEGSIRGRIHDYDGGGDEGSHCSDEDQMVADFKENLKKARADFCNKENPDPASTETEHKQFSDKIPDLKIEVYGNITAIWLKGKFISDGVSKIAFTHNVDSSHSMPECTIEQYISDIQNYGEPSPYDLV